jgi:hypothetical protein
MNSWEHVRKEGIEYARNFFARLKAPQMVDESFARWWRELRTGTDYPGRAGAAVHPATRRLSGELREQGVGEVAEYLENFSQIEGPIHPGQWSLSFLLGRSAALIFAERLKHDELECPFLFGLESFGAWEAFIARSIEIFRTDSDVKARAIDILEKAIAQAAVDPLLNVMIIPRDKDNFKKTCEDYSKYPSVKEAWHSNIDGVVFFKPFFLIGMLLEVEPTETMRLIGLVPHPAYLQRCFGEDIAVQSFDALALLLTAAPLAYDSSGTFMAQGMVVVALLKLSAKYLRNTAWGAKREHFLVPIERADELGAFAENTTAVAARIVDILMQRIDADQLAWAWFDRLMFEGIRHGDWTIKANVQASCAIDPLAILISALAERLSPKADFAKWIDGKPPALRIDGFFASVAVAMWGIDRSVERTRQIMEWGICKSEIYLPISVGSIDGTTGVVRRVGGHAIAIIPDAAAWFRSTWNEIRPRRERSWRQGYAERKNVDEIMVLCGLGALELVAGQTRGDLWQAVEEAIRDGSQTDDLRLHNGFWAQALVKLFQYFPRAEFQSTELQTERLAIAVLPYVEPNASFLNLIVNLSGLGWSSEALHAAVAKAGFNLTRLIDQFALMLRPEAKGQVYDFKWLATLSALKSNAG